MKEIYETLCIGVGGAIGAVCRYLLCQFIDPKAKLKFPLAVFIINCVGCLVIGFFTTCPGWDGLSDWLRHSIITGFTGGFTTFSTFATQTWNLLFSENCFYGIINVIANHIAGFLCAYCGQLIGENV